MWRTSQMKIHRLRIETHFDPWSQLPKMVGVKRWTPSAWCEGLRLNSSLRGSVRAPRVRSVWADFRGNSKDQRLIKLRCGRLERWSMSHQRDDLRPTRNLGRHRLRSTLRCNQLWFPSKDTFSFRRQRTPRSQRKMTSLRHTVSSLTDGFRMMNWQISMVSHFKPG